MKVRTDLLLAVEPISWYMAMLIVSGEAVTSMAQAPPVSMGPVADLG